ncbi:MAG TPA: CotH kinase family protein [Vicinamibacterales bacterium]|nr:CotH kinase family protein [Vicinamibacterales bacterium]
MIRALVFFALLVPAAAVAQTSDELFDSRALHEVRLYIHSSDLQLLRDRYREDIYVPADFEWRGIRVRNVGVRVRGLATRSPMKPGLRIEFNRYVAGQTFLGMAALVLDNALKDASFVRERVSMAFIKRMGQPAPRESFARVFINGRLEGLYVLVEAVDPAFLARELGDGLGYLFEHKYAGGFHGEFLGEDYAPYKARFEAETHRLESDYALYAPIRELLREVNQDVDAVWRERVEWLIDLNQAVTHVAIETFLAEHDGFVGGAGMANFFLYRPIEGNRHRLIAWDRDTTFQDVEAPLFNRVGENALMSRALRFRDLRTLFLDVLEQCARAASEDRWLETEIYEAHLLIRDAAHEDAAKPFSNDDYEAAIAHLMTFAQRRPAFVLDEVARAR